MVKDLMLTKEEDFNQFIERIKKIERREKAKSSQSTVNEQFPALNSSVIELEDASSESDDSSSDYENEIEHKDSLKEDSLLEPDMNSEEKINEKGRMYESLEKLRAIVADSSSVSSKIEFFQETLSILEYLVKMNETFQCVEFYQSFSNEVDSIRFIPEEDETCKQDSNSILIEGILPVLSRGYNIAMKQREIKRDEPDFGPPAIMSLLIRYSFPDHWIQGTTLRGTKGRHSLINTWNHLSPLLFPLQNHVDNELGELRFRALLGE